jgi:N6-L-threonylcarbamoyladenine synthase
MTDIAADLSQEARLMTQAHDEQQLTTQAAQYGTVLGIESTCDETAAAVISNGQLVSNVVASSMLEHARYGGVIPEIASRAHAESFVPVVSKALADANLDLSQIDAIAVSAGPGLAGCLAVGVSGAKALAWASGKPIFGINHVIGHIAVTQLQFGAFPDDTLALIVSGGHTSLLHVRDVARHIDVVGTTLDDAAGECFDKIARLLGFPYPGGPHIDRHARMGNPHAIRVPKGLTQGKSAAKHPYDFSFSGVKTAVARWIEGEQAADREIPIDDVCASLADSVADVLATKAMAGCEAYDSSTLIVGGGFSANSQLRAKLQEYGDRKGVQVRIPRIALCTDNGAMVAMLGANLLDAGIKPSSPDFPIDSAMPLTQIVMP